MEIRITKGKNRNQLSCKRKDGTMTSLNLGPDIPNHDIAHYVVEKAFRLEQGFYGKLNAGMTIEELSNKENIKKFGPETWLSEIMARNLQSLGSEAANIEQFIDLIQWEVQQVDGLSVPNMNLTTIKKIKSDFEGLCNQWDALPENGVLRLIF